MASGDERDELRKGTMRAFWGLAIELKSIFGRDFGAIAGKLVEAARHETRSPSELWPVEDLPGFERLSTLDRADLIADVLCVRAARIAWAGPSRVIGDFDAESFMAEAQDVARKVAKTQDLEGEEHVDG